MPMVCRGGLCAWDDQDVTGHAFEDQPAFTIGHPDDPNNGQIVRIHFDDPEAERAFMERLERERQAAAT
jgi:hypothetical protein